MLVSLTMYHTQKGEMSCSYVLMSHIIYSICHDQIESVDHAFLKMIR